MQTNTFCHVPGLGLETERRLWSAGLRSWDGFGEGSAFEHTSGRKPHEPSAQ